LRALKRLPLERTQDACHSLSSVIAGSSPIGAKISGVSRAQRSASLKGVYARLRALWASGALQTPISGLPEIGAQMRAGRVNPTCVDRYAHHLREGPGTAAHRFRDTWSQPAAGQGGGFAAGIAADPLRRRVDGRGDLHLHCRGA
jgi:hypothetical protein